MYVVGGCHVAFNGAVLLEGDVAVYVVCGCHVAFTGTVLLEGDVTVYVAATLRSLVVESWMEAGQCCSTAKAEHKSHSLAACC